MNLCLLLFFLANGAFAAYNIDVTTLEKSTNDFLNPDLRTELRLYPFGLNDGGKPGPFLGTNFFQGPRKNCLFADDTALMSARKDFDKLVPKSYPSCLSSDSAVHMLIRYWSTVNQVVHLWSDMKTRRPLEQAFYDTLGGYLRFYLVPVAQVSFYAGRMNLNTVERLVTIKRECHSVLRTNGLGWRAPAAEDLMEQLKDAKIEPVRLGVEGASNCDQLDLSGGPEQSDSSQDLALNSNQGQMAMPMPSLEPVDAYGYLTGLFLPFRQPLVYNLRSSSSAFELVRFFQTITGCHRFLGMSQANYNRKLLNWVQELIQQHLGDEQFYPGLGGILQIRASLLTENHEKEKDVAKDEDSSKLGRSIEHAQGQEGTKPPQADEYQVEWLFVPASVVLIVVFLIIICCLHCGREKTKEKPAPTKQVPDDVESALNSSKMSKPKRVKKDKKDKKERSKVKVEKSPLKSTKDRRYYGNPTLSVSSDDCSTSTLGYHLKEKIMPVRFEGARGKDRSGYKYSPVSSEQYDMEPSSEVQDKEQKKKSGRGK